jgi:hypothetical protein
VKQTGIAQKVVPSPATSSSVFARQEKKYPLVPGTAERLVFLLGPALELDGFGPALIRSLYLDTPDHLLIRRSIERPDFKEKLRIRTYGNVTSDSHPAFLELKKKYRGTVYKRRVKMTLREALSFTTEGIVPLSPYQGNPTTVALNRQIMDEMQWALVHYKTLTPSIALSYERSAYTYRTTDTSLRLTIDRDLRWHKGTGELPKKLEMQSACGTLSTQGSMQSACGTPLLPEGACLMELKTFGALPLALTRALDELQLYPQSFSKVGRAYQAFRAGGNFATVTSCDATHVTGCDATRSTTHDAGCSARCDAERGTIPIASCDATLSKAGVQ